MKNRCVNYKFILISLLSILGIIFGILLLICAEKIYIFPFIFLSLSIILLICLIILEPVGYLICADGIKVKFIFRNYYFEWKNIKYIEVHYDPRFNTLFIKDYYLITTDNLISIDKKRIMKYKKTTKLIEELGHAKIRGKAD